MSRTHSTGTLDACFLPARLVENHLIQPVTVTRIGRHGAQLSGSSPVPEGEYTVLELDRPTDGERVRVGVRVLRIRTEGTQWGWKPAIHIAFLDPMTGLAPVELPTAAELAQSVGESLASGDVEPVRIRSLSLSYDDTAEDLPAAGVVEAELPPRLSSDQVLGLALGLSELDATRALPAAMRVRGVLPAMYGAPACRREEAHTPWSEPAEARPAHPDREKRILSSSPVAYLTSGRHRAGMVQDFSRGGMFMAVHRGEPIPPVGATLRVEFAVPRPPTVFLIGLTAEVRWVHEGERPSEPGRGAGMVIVGFDRAEGREVYASYVESLIAAEETDAG